VLTNRNARWVLPNGPPSLVPAPTPCTEARCGPWAVNITITRSAEGRCPVRCDAQLDSPPRLVGATAFAEEDTCPLWVTLIHAAASGDVRHGVGRSIALILDSFVFFAFSIPNRDDAFSKPRVVHGAVEAMRLELSPLGNRSVERRRYRGALRRRETRRLRLRSAIVRAGQKENSAPSVRISPRHHSEQTRHRQAARVPPAVCPTILPFSGERTRGAKRARRSSDCNGQLGRTLVEGDALTGRECQSICVVDENHRLPLRVPGVVEVEGHGFAGHERHRSSCPGCLLQ